MVVRRGVILTRQEFSAFVEAAEAVQIVFVPDEPGNSEVPPADPT